MGRKGRQGGVVLAEGSRSASSGWSFCSEGATGGGASCLRAQVWPSRWKPFGSDAREASPGSAALPGGVRLVRMGQQECSSIPDADMTLPVEVLASRVKEASPCSAALPKRPGRRPQRGFLVHPPQNLRAARGRHQGRKPSLPSLPNRAAVGVAITPGGSTARRSRWNEGCDLRRGPACARPPGRRSQRGERFALTRIVRLPPLP